MPDPTPPIDRSQPTTATRTTTIELIWHGDAGPGDDAVLAWVRAHGEPRAELKYAGEIHIPYANGRGGFRIITRERWVTHRSGLLGGATDEQLADLGWTLDA